MHSAKFLALFGALAFFTAEVSLSQDEDFGEATGLEEEVVGPPVPERNDAFARAMQFRGYLKGRHVTLRGPTRESALAGEAALETRSNFGNRVEFFSDLGATFDEAATHGSLVVNQLGVRARVANSWTLTVGKERNRRSPGLLVSPSDVLHGDQPLPGMEEDRSGVWLARGSWAAPRRSMDMILLPVDWLNEQGMPRDDAKPLGAIWRYFQQFSNIDAQVSMGTMDENRVFGTSAQGFVFGVWKVYGEAGYREAPTKFVFQREEAWSYLVGAGYEGSDRWTARLEYYRDESGLSDEETAFLWKRMTSGPFDARASVSIDPSSSLDPFMGRNYAIASLSLIEVADRWNVSHTLIHDLDGRDTIAFSRISFLADARNEIGLSVLSVDKQSDLAQVMYPFAWIAGMDWKWSF